MQESIKPVEIVFKTTLTIKTVFMTTKNIYGIYDNTALIELKGVLSSTHFSLNVEEINAEY